MPTQSAPRQARVALIHEWLTDWGGSESVLAAIAGTLERPDLFALIDFLAAEDRARLPVSKIETTYLQKLPFSRTHFWNYLPLMPFAIEHFDLRGYDTIISSSHAVAKGALTTAEQLHVSYVHSPMRYAWDLHHEYLDDYGLNRGLKGFIARWIFHRLRQWDRQTANNVDLFIANSRYVAQRIWRTYRRPSCVIYPPVDVDNFDYCERKDDYYLSVSRLVSYKRVDLIVEAFRGLPERKLIVIGDGPEAARLKANCPANVSFLGHQPITVVRETMAKAKAFVFAATEDFGITPVEAQACGTPVIAYGRGGALETVRDINREGASPTGIFFPQQTPASLREAILRFETVAPELRPDNCRRWAETFSATRFNRQFTEILEAARTHWCKNPELVERLVAASAPIA